MQPSDINILKLIPQRPPFVVVDSLDHYDSLHTVTSFLITDENLFVEQGYLTQPGITENIAQTCAIRMGYINFLAGRPVKLGVIGAIRNMLFHTLPPIGATLTTRITVMQEVFQMTLVNADVWNGTTLVATAQMKIAITDIDAQLPTPNAAV